MQFSLLSIGGIYTREIWLSLCFQSIDVSYYLGFDFHYFFTIASLIEISSLLSTKRLRIGCQTNLTSQARPKSQSLSPKYICKMGNSVLTPSLPPRRHNTVSIPNPPYSSVHTVLSLSTEDCPPSAIRRTHPYITPSPPVRTTPIRWPWLCRRGVHLAAGRAPLRYSDICPRVLLANTAIKRTFKPRARPARPGQSGMASICGGRSGSYVGIANCLVVSLVATSNFKNAS